MTFDSYGDEIHMQIKYIFCEYNMNLTFDLQPFTILYRYVHYRHLVIRVFHGFMSFCGEKLIVDFTFPEPKKMISYELFYFICRLLSEDKSNTEYFLHIANIQYKLSLPFVRQMSVAYMTV